jgi:hypothetical protein
MPNFEVPIIPLYSVSGLRETLFAFQRQLIQSWRATASATNNPVTTLLPYCSVNTPIPEHARNVLSDIFHGISELTQAATTEDGKAFIKSYLDDASQGAEGVAEGIIEFWGQEYIIDG